MRKETRRTLYTIIKGRKHSLESVWETGLFVIVAYLSQYIASTKGLLFDELLLLGIALSSVILNITAHFRVVRGSGNRWVIFSNRSIVWLFGVFVGALSGGLPDLFGLISQYLVLALVAGFFLLLVFLIIDLNKHTEELVKPQSKPTA